MAFTSRDVENTLRTIFRRCVQCPPGQAPSCPQCDEGYVCAQTPLSCSQCASTSCVPNTVDPTNSTSSKSSGPNVGAIAGGVVGGVVFMAIITFIIWKFCLKGRRQKYEEGEWQQVDIPIEKSDARDDFTIRRDARSSTHTMASMTSSILTRASNIIQIAYIPGVTNRSGPGSPDLLVPPVPPIPIATSPNSALSSPYSTEDQHFFVPGDLRDSTYSGLSDGRSSYARTSIAPSLARSSVATTIYRNNAIVSPLPAQTIVRGKAAVVSVKSGGPNSPTDTPGSETPPVPQIESKFIKPMRIQMPHMTSSSSLSPQGSVRSTATVAKPVALTIKKKGSATSVATSSQPSTSEADSQASDTPKMRPLTEVSLAETEDSTVPHSRARKSAINSPDMQSTSESESEDDDHSRARRSLLHNSSNRDSELTEIQDTPGMIQSPFTDVSSTPASPDIPQRHPSRASTGVGPSGLETVMEEKRSSRSTQGSKRERSPFSDDNAVRDS